MHEDDDHFFDDKALILRLYPPHAFLQCIEKKQLPEERDTLRHKRECDKLAINIKQSRRIPSESCPVSLLSVSDSGPSLTFQT